MLTPVVPIGYAVPNDRDRYVEGREWDTNMIVARELYDHIEDADESRKLRPPRKRRDCVPAVTGSTAGLARGFSC